MVTEAQETRSVGNSLDEPDQAVALVERRRIETGADRLLRLEPFRAGVDALPRGALAGRAVLVP